MRYFISLKNTRFDDISLIGGKATSLGIMSSHKFPVPDGYVLTTEAYETFYGKEFDQILLDEIYKVTTSLKSDTFAVRSSAVMEDSTRDSWAGQFESYLNVPKQDLIRKITQCWDSLSSDRATEYAKGKYVQRSMGVIVQSMIQSDISGVVFTRNPVESNHKELIIESTYGLGEILVQGKITPDSFIVDKDTYEVKRKASEKKDMIVMGINGNKLVRVPENKVNSLSLSYNQIKKITDIAIRIERLFGKPQDIEWAIQGEFLYILQSRPITTI